MTGAKQKEDFLGWEKCQDFEQFSLNRREAEQACAGQWGEYFRWFGPSASCLSGGAEHTAL